jgi:trimeric autotransporter adhesin
MNNRTPKIVAMTLLAASVLVTPSARAQLQGGAGTMSGSNAEDFDDLVAQDVAKGYYTAEQGEQLKAQWDQSMQNLTESLQTAQTSVQRTESLALSGNQMTMNQVSSLANAQGQPTLGGTPEEVEEQAKAIYNAAHMQLEVGQAQIENVAPVLQTAINEISTVMNARNALIQSNPNVSPAVKHNAGRESAQVEDATKNALQSGIGKFTEQMQQAQATLDNNKQQIINQIENTINTQVAANGSNPANWTKPATPAKTPAPATATNPPSTPAAQAPTTGPVSPTTLVPSNNGPITGTTTKTTTGTVPSNQGDPAFSVNRNSNNGNSNNGQGNTSASNTAGNSGAPKNPAANNGVPAKANNNSNQSGQPPVRISQVLTPPNVSKPQTPSPPAKLNQQDLNNALNKKPNIPELQVALPLPTDAPPNAPKDDKGIALLDKPPATPGNAKAVVKGAPPSKSPSDVTVPVPLKSPSDLPLPIDVHLDNPSQSQDPVGAQPSQTGQSQDQAGQPQGTAAASSEDGATGTGSSSAAAAAAVAANAAAAVADAATAAADAASAATDAAAAGASAGDPLSNAGALNKTPNATIIPNSPNNPNAESMTDPSFNAYRNNPDGAPPDSTSQSGDVTTGTSNPNPGGFVPPNQQNNSQDSSAATAAQADAAAAAAAAAVSDSTATGPTPAPPSNPPSSNPTLDQMQAQIASQLKAGNLGGHLVEGDEGMEGTTDATASVQMAAISNLDQSVELGDTLTTATLASIYTGYTVTAGQNGSSVIVAGTTQVQTPSSLMISPSMQVSTPGAMMTSPSMQVLFPSSVMTDPSMQVQFPDALLVIPSSQINFPSSLMTSLDLQVALCGR